VANVESMDYDPLVVKLNKDISAIEEAMGAGLQQHKFQYIFEGQHGPGLKFRQQPEKSRQRDDHLCHVDSQIAEYLNPMRVFSERTISVFSLSSPPSH